MNIEKNIKESSLFIVDMQIEIVAENKHEAIKALRKALSKSTVCDRWPMQIKATYEYKLREAIIEEV